jgi:hypothetical protein
MKGDSFQAAMRSYALTILKKIGGWSIAAPRKLRRPIQPGAGRYDKTEFVMSFFVL